MNSRGQSALEYLMTYGWALVVIVIVIAALFAFGVFSTPKNCSPTGGGMFIKDKTIGSSGISLSIQNAAGATMTGITVSAAGTASGCTGLTANATNPTTLSQADTNIFTLDGTCSGNVNVPITLTYSAGSPPLSHTDTTTCTGTV